MNLLIDSKTGKIVECQNDIQKLEHLSRIGPEEYCEVESQFYLVQVTWEKWEPKTKRLRFDIYFPKQTIFFGESDFTFWSLNKRDFRINFGFKKFDLDHLLRMVWHVEEHISLKCHDYKPILRSLLGAPGV